MGALKAYAPRDNKYVVAKNKLLNNVENLYKGREKIIEGFKNRVFPFYYDERHEHQMKAEREIEEKRRRRKEKKEKQDEQDKEPFDLDEFIEQIFNREKLPINNELFKKHFKLEKPIIMCKVLKEQEIIKKKIVN